MKIRCVQVALLSVAMLAFPTSADAVFHIWIEAPAEVQAGSTFTANVWGSADGPAFNSNSNAFQAFWGDVVASGLNVEFADAVGIICNGGEPDSNALRNVQCWNYPSIHPFYTDNPFPLFSTNVTITDGQAGVLVLDLRPSEDRNNLWMLSWWSDYLNNEYALDTDLGSTRIITPATIRVIPAPGAFVLFSLAICTSLRRRR